MQDAGRHELPQGLAFHRTVFQIGYAQLLIGALGTFVAIANVSFQPQLSADFPLFLVPAIVMITMLLGGWIAGASGVILTVLACLASGGDVATVAMTGGVALVGGEMLRLGLRPLVPAALLFGAILLSYRANGPAGVSLIESCASALTNAGLNTALAVTVLILMPRRSVAFPVRCRVRWDHIVFAVVIGKLAVAILLFMGWMYPDAHANGYAWGAGTSLRICILFVIASAANIALTLRFSTIARQLRRRLWRKSQWRTGATSRWFGPESPAEMAELLIAIRRETRQLRRERARLAQKSEAAEERVRELTRALDAAQEKIRARDRRLAELARANEHARGRYRVLMDQSIDVTLFCDAKGIIQAANRSSLRLLGYQPVDLKGQPLTTLVPPGCLDGHPLDRSKMADKDTAVMTSAVLRAASGQVRKLGVVVRAFPVGDSINYLIQLREAGRMEKALATLRQARTLAQSADRSREMFIATMSHELRTPLHALIATLDMMRVTERCPPELGRHLSVARISARSLLKIANDILDLTRIGSNHFALEQRAFSPQSMIHELIAESQARADSLGLSLRSLVLDPLPRALLGDPTRLRQILSNLLANALKFTRSGSVTLQTSFDGTTSTFDVIDTGPGIPVEKWDSIFDPFIQVESGNGHPGGTGLGLPISRRLAEAMGGTLTVLRSNASGSTFRLTVPLPVTNETPVEEQSMRILANPYGRILVVEDNPANRYVAEALLSHFGCPTTLVASGEEALEQLASDEFDLILMDCQMPGIDGFETTRRARALLKHHVPIVAMTANTMDEDNQRCLDAGMDDFLPKPFGRPALHAILSKWLSGSEARPPADDLGAQLRRLPVLDLTVFEELQRSLHSRPDMLRRIGSSFLLSAHEALNGFDARNPGDRGSLRRHLHTLLGSAGMIGARQAEFLARKLQSDLAANRFDEAGSAWARLKRAIRDFDTEFHRRLLDDPQSFALVAQA